MSKLTSFGKWRQRIQEADKLVVSNPQRASEILYGLSIELAEHAARGDESPAWATLIDRSRTTTNGKA